MRLRCHGHGQPEGVVPPVETAVAAAPAVDSTAVGDPNQETPETYEIYADVETPETLDAPRAGGPPASKPVPPPPPRFGYNVYEAAPAAQRIRLRARRFQRATPATADNAPDTPVAPVLPLNAALLTTPAFSDPARGVWHRALLRRASCRNGGCDRHRKRAFAARLRYADRQVPTGAAKDR